jgi:hypothetical protein
MALIEVCDKLIDTKLVFSGKAAIKYSQEALEKELQRQKDEQNEKLAVSVEYSQDYLASLSQSEPASQNEGEEILSNEQSAQISQNEPALPEPSQMPVGRGGGENLTANSVANLGEIDLRV